MRFFLRLSCCSPVNSRDCFDLLPTVSGIHLPSMSLMAVAHQESLLVCMHSQSRGCRRRENLIPMLQTASEHCQSSSMYRDDIDSIASDRKISIHMCNIPALWRVFGAVYCPLQVRRECWQYTRLRRHSRPSVMLLNSQRHPRMSSPLPPIWVVAAR